MTRPLTVAPSPLPPAPALLQAVDRAVAELRRGGIVGIRDAGGRIAVAMAAEAASPESLARLAALARGGLKVALTNRRAAVLGMAVEGADIVEVTPASLDQALVDALADPAHALDPAHRLEIQAAEAGACAAGAVRLAKLARLLPAAVLGDSPGGADALFIVSVEDVAAYQQVAARSLRPVSEARVPLADAEATRIVAFRPSDGGIEHLAIIIGEPDGDQPVLARLHSECFTGDLLGSLRCDCGDQLRGAIAEIAAQGSGVLLYLAQEGRGIGLVNKLRAYQLQDLGFDTLDANGQLGFDDDERIYLPAAQMLSLLGIKAVRLLTNNPAKVEALTRHGVTVTERVPHIFPSNDHNQGYLRTKATKGGHLF